jgi:hypothetical protein
MGITKPQSAFLALCFIVGYTYSFFEFLTLNQFYTWTLGAFVVGQVFMFLRKI